MLFCVAIQNPAVRICPRVLISRNARSQKASNSNGNARMALAHRGVLYRLRLSLSESGASNPRAWRKRSRQRAKSPCLEALGRRRTDTTVEVSRQTASTERRFALPHLPGSAERRLVHCARRNLPRSAVAERFTRSSFPREQEPCQRRLA